MTFEKFFKQFKKKIPQFMRDTDGGRTILQWIYESGQDSAIAKNKAEYDLGIVEGYEAGYKASIAKVHAIPLRNMFDEGYESGYKAAEKEYKEELEEAHDQYDADTENMANFLCVHNKYKVSLEEIADEATGWAAGQRIAREALEANQ